MTARPLKRASKAPFPIRALRSLKRALIDPPYRYVLWMHLLHPRASFQPYNQTSRDRYPFIFRFVQTQLGAHGKARILSFGCSTGEEVFSLRGYFPSAFIKGLDINPGNIAICQARLKEKADAGLLFAVADSTAAEQGDFYDAIFCMAVLRHGALSQPGVTRCDHLLPFAKFAQATEDFRRCLKPGGLLVIRYSNFRLCDAPAGQFFETVLSVPIHNSTATPLFKPDNQIMCGATYPDVVFRKRAEFAPPAD